MSGKFKYFLPLGTVLLRQNSRVLVSGQRVQLSSQLTAHSSNSSNSSIMLKLTSLERHGQGVICTSNKSKHTFDLPADHGEVTPHFPMMTHKKSTNQRCNQISDFFFFFVFFPSPSSYYHYSYCCCGVKMLSRPHTSMRVVEVKYYCKEERQIERKKKIVQLYRELTAHRVYLGKAVVTGHRCLPSPLRPVHALVYIAAQRSFGIPV